VDRFCKFDCEFILSGYADNKGSSDYNLKLSKKRVTAVSEIIKAKGINAKKIRIRHIGILSGGVNETDELRRKERRVEIMLITK
jgi:OmpA-OmpF porin, OOP family